MDNASRNIASFVLRFTEELWQDALGEPHVQWRGQVSHVQGDEEATFTQLSEALAFIQRHLTQLTLNAVSGEKKMDQEKALRESFKLWEQFASTYSDMMFSAMERTIQQSEALKGQMDEAVEKALKSWQMPLQSDQDKIVSALDKLADQVQALAAKVEKLEKSLKKE